MFRYPGIAAAVSLVTGIAIVASIWFAGYFIDRRRFANFGVHLNADWWMDFGFGLALGAILMGAIFLVEWAAGWITIESIFQSPSSAAFLPAILSQVLFFTSVGIYEEFVSRGYHMKNLSEGLRFLGERGAILVSLVLAAAVFGIAHAFNPNASFISTFNIVLAGIMLGLGYVLTGELAIPIGLHITWNFFQGNVFGFPVSGSTSGISFIAISQGGPELITGGAFGPEAGLVGIAAMALGSFLTIAWVRRRYGQVSLFSGLTQPELVHAPGEEPVTT